MSAVAAMLTGGPDPDGDDELAELIERIVLSVVVVSLTYAVCQAVAAWLR